MLVSDGRIRPVGAPVEGYEGPALDGAGTHLIPGIWDTEAYLTRSGHAVPADMALKWPDEGDPELPAANLRAHLGHGVTTVVDLGGPVELLATCGTVNSAVRSRAPACFRSGYNSRRLLGHDVGLCESFSRLGDERLLQELGARDRADPSVLAALDGNPESLGRSRSEEWLEFNRARFDAAMRFVAPVHRAGVRMTGATDAGNPALFHGISAQREMELMERAGIEPVQIIRSATSLAAERFGEGDEVGTVEEGKRADLVLIDGDPLDRIANVREIAAVIQEGRVLEPASTTPPPVG